MVYNLKIIKNITQINVVIKNVFYRVKKYKNSSYTIVSNIRKVFKIYYSNNLTLYNLIKRV